MASPVAEQRKEPFKKLPSRIIEMSPYSETNRKSHVDKIAQDLPFVTVLLNV